jgi:hypothetical protein
VIARQALAFALILHLVRVGRQRGQFGGADQDFLLTRRRVHIPQLAVFPFVVALHVGELRPVGTPLHVFGTAPGEPSGRKHRVNGQRFHGRRRLRPKGLQQAREKHQRDKGKTGE